MELNFSNTKGRRAPSRWNEQVEKYWRVTTPLPQPISREIDQLDVLSTWSYS